MAPTILLVDDEAEFRSAICSVLNGEDYSTLEASDGLEAWILLQSLHEKGTLDTIYAVVSDLSMPKLNGVGLLQKIRETAGFNKLPFVLITGMLSHQDAIKLAVHGPDIILVKPFDVTLLINRIEEAKQKRQPTPVPALST